MTQEGRPYRDLGLLEKSLLALQYLDWLSPWYALWGDIRYGLSKVAHIVIDLRENPAFSDRDLKKVLEAHGIKSWGYIYTTDSLMFSIPQWTWWQAVQAIGDVGIAVKQVALPPPWLKWLARWIPGL